MSYPDHYYQKMKEVSMQKISTLRLHRETSAYFVGDVYRLHDGHPPMRAKGSMPSLSILHIGSFKLQYINDEGLEENPIAYAAVALDGNMSMCRVIFHVGLCDKIKKANVSVGSLILIQKHHFIWYQPNKYGVKRAFMLISEFEHRPPRDPETESYSLYHIHTDSIFEVFDEFVFGLAESFQRKCGIFFLKNMFPSRVLAGKFIASRKEKQEFVKNQNQFPAIQSQYEDLCTCRSTLYCMDVCIVQQLNPRDLQPWEIVDASMNSSSTVFESLDNNSKRNSLYRFYALNVYGSVNTKEKLPECLVNCVRDLYE